MVFFTLGYVVIWILILGYTALIRSQQSKLEKQIVILEERLREQERAAES